MAAKILGPIGLKAFEDRGIGAETAVRFGIYTGSRVEETGEVLPDPDGNIVVFPTEERGTVVAEKYRVLPWSGHRMWQRPGPRRTFWNSDILDDPALAAGHQALIITEGELDAITAIDCGFQFTVSVPDGAPSVPKGKEPTDLEPIEPAGESTGKFEFIWNNRERLKVVKRFVIAVDNDGPGKRLAAELVRRLSASRCLFVTYPEGCKDLNDVRMRDGAEAVAAVLNCAKPYPVHGLYRLKEFPELPAIRTFKTGWWTLDRNLQLFAGELMFVLGIPGHGKSVFIANLLANLSDQYGWRSVIFSPEEPTVPHMRDKLRRIYLGPRRLDLDVAGAAQADDWINDRFLFIAADPLGQTDQEVYLDWILDRATDAVLRDGVQVLVIDPWNEVEHARLPRETQTEYIGRAIRMINRFRHTYGVIVIVLIHPTKEVGKEGKSRPPTPYDADGSAHWFNKADHFLIIHRPDETVNISMVRVAKVKFEGTGEKGTMRLKFDRESCRFDTIDGSSSEADAA